jgi:hypothetical protein
LEYSNYFFKKVSDLKNLQKVYFKFIPSLLQFKFGLNAFESFIFLKNSNLCFKIVKRNFCSPLPIRPDGFSSPALFLFIFRAGPSKARLVLPTSAQAGPSPGRHLPSATEATATLPSRRHNTCRRRPPSRTRMEQNQSTARLPSLSRTSSVPHRLPSPIQC